MGKMDTPEPKFALSLKGLRSFSNSVLVLLKQSSKFRVLLGFGYSFLKLAVSVSNVVTVQLR